MSDPIGFNLTNYFNHPDRPGWVVFRFPDALQMHELEAEFQQASIRYEADQTNEPPFMIAVRQGDRAAAIKLNYMVIGRHRDPMIRNKWLGWMILLVTLLLISVAVAGWLKS